MSDQKKKWDQLCEFVVDIIRLSDGSIGWLGSGEFKSV
jgi:hypothetical protein